MRLLLDTHILVWALAEPNKLPTGAAALVKSREHDIFFSVASVWEISIKAALGRAGFPEPVGKIVEAARSSGFVELPVYSADALAVATLPLHHRDPFDRLLVAQAVGLPARLLTADAQLQAYSELVTLV